MTPADHDFTAHVNTAFSQVVVILAPDDIPVDLTGTSPRMEVRAKCEEPPVLVFQQSDGTVTDFDAPNGQFRLAMPSSSITDDKAGSYLYDLLLIKTDSNERPLQGVFNILNTVTEEPSP